jgi:hypothetical protein
VRIAKIAVRIDKSFAKNAEKCAKTIEKSAARKEKRIVKSVARKEKRIVKSVVKIEENSAGLKLARDNLLGGVSGNRAWHLLVSDKRSLSDQNMQSEVFS